MIPGIHDIRRASIALAVAFSVAACAGCGAITGMSKDAGLESTIQQVRPGIVGPGKGVIPDTWDDIHAFQVFDGDIPPRQAEQDAYRYDAVWGTQEPASWRAGNPRIVTSFYAAFDGDFGHNTLAWWKNHFPSWILYKCDKKTPAYPSGLSNIPLDISNPAVVAWQMQTYGPTIEADNYTGLAVDLVGLNNADGGCGVWINGVWTQRFTGKLKDDAWSQAVLGWFHYAYAYLHALPRPLVLEANNVPENRPLGDPEQIDLLNHMDLLDDESSFTLYGNGYASDATVALIVGWMKYTQSIGKAWVVDDKWNTQSLSDPQRGWSISSANTTRRRSSQTICRATVTNIGTPNTIARSALRAPTRMWSGRTTDSTFVSIRTRSSSRMRRSTRRIRSRCRTLPTSISSAIP
jgi:hypothetical protein